MKQKLKKMISLFLVMLMLLCIVPIVFAQGHGEIIETYHCDDSYHPCDFSWELYEDGTLIINGNGSLTDHIIDAENTIKKVIISDTVNELNSYVFGYLDGITHIEVSDMHPSYTSLDGVLFNEDCSVLLHYPSAKTAENYTIPETVETIARNAFYGAKIKSVVITENVKTIYIDAFRSSLLESVSFESINRNLFIDNKAFADCKNLTEINLNAQALYSISTSAFDDSAFYENEANWEDGVLYINDILLAVDETKMEKEYALKEGTKVIADSIWHLIFVEPGEEYDGIQVTIPNSVDNFGTYSVIYEENRKNIFRAGRFFYAFSEGFSDEILQIYQEWIDKFEVGYSVSDLKSVPNAVLFFIETYGGFVQSIQPGLICSLLQDNVKFELYKFDNIKGFADDNSQFNPLTFSIAPTLCDGYIFPDSMEWIGRFSPLNEINTMASMQFFPDEGEQQENLAREKSLTFLNADCYINDSAETIWHGYTICGYTDSTAYEYAMKYNRKFVDISNCTHDEKASKYALEATCSCEGYTGDIYCQYCGELLEEGTIIPKTENHSFGEWEIVSYPSCVEDGTRKHTCELCGKEATGIYQTAYGHKYIETIKPAICTQSGVKITTCENCSFYEYETLSATGHKDENNDYKCDVCGEQLKIDCDCNCHKSGFMEFIYKITQFFWRLFRINQVCGCGVYHY